MSSPSFLSPELKQVAECVRVGARLAHEVEKANHVASLSKKDHSPVTVADFAIQALVSFFLEKHFPSDALVAEESSDFLRKSENVHVLEEVTKLFRQFAPEAGSVSSADVCRLIDRGKAEATARFWTLDPIDGTKGFIRGDHYAVALALIEHGQVTTAFLGCPKLKDAYETDKNHSGALVAAVKGKGSWCTSLSGKEDWRALHVSDTPNMAKAIFIRSFEDEHTHASHIDQMTRSLGMTRPVIRMDSLAKYAVLASGKADLLCRIPSEKKADYRENIWDQASGDLAVREAGGRVTDLDGKALDFSTGRKLLKNRGILASNGHLHDEALRAIAAVETLRSA